MLPNWFNSLAAAENNASVLSLLLSRWWVLSSIRSNGCKIAGTEFTNSVSITSFNSSLPVPNTEELQLNVPVHYNNNNVAGILVHIKDKYRTAIIVRIQITITGRHRGSDERFFRHNWRKLVIPLDGYELTAKFLWIKESIGSAKDLLLSLPSIV